jgi:GNAT superfamily N-acetyltransferase
MGTSISWKVKKKNFTNKVIRYLTNFQRPSKRTNVKLLQQRGETLSSFIVREATVEDLPALVSLHVKTWNETYPNFKKPPTYEIREYQWLQQFKIADGSWFCYVIENNKRELIGFAKGKRNEDNTGVIDKIYLLRNYQRLGLGSKLVGYVARRFLNMGVNNIALFGIPQNPSCYFHKSIGGEKLYADNGEFHGGYIWRDIQRLASFC